jgi:hypothetical protein
MIPCVRAEAKNNLRHIARSFSFRPAESEAIRRDYCPVPLSEMLCGGPLAVSVIIKAAVKGPVVVGAKCP